MGHAARLEKRSAQSEATNGMHRDAAFLLHHFHGLDRNPAKAVNFLVKDFLNIRYRFIIELLG